MARKSGRRAEAGRSNSGPTAALIPTVPRGRNAAGRGTPEKDLSSKSGSCAGGTRGTTAFLGTTSEDLCLVAGDHAGFASVTSPRRRTENRGLDSGAAPLQDRDTMKAVARTSHDDDLRRLEAINALVHAHSKLEDVHTGALWLPRWDGPAVKLLEIIPSMPIDARADEPMEFLPSKDFRYTLQLINGRAADLRDAIERNGEFAQAVLDGVPVPAPTPATKALQAFARKVVGKPKPTP